MTSCQYNFYPEDFLVCRLSEGALALFDYLSALAVDVIIAVDLCDTSGCLLCCAAVKKHGESKSTLITSRTRQRL